MTAIKNLVFDLGNVIIDIDYAETVTEFQKLAVGDFSQILSYTSQLKLFDVFERGEITATEFRNDLRRFLKADTSDVAINFAWNAIIRNYPPEKFRLLSELKNRYATFALSNINEIHVETIKQGVNKNFGANDIHDYFHHVYYSNQVGHRKPEKEIYELLLARENLNPAETFFVDDKAENIEAAKLLGFQAHHLSQREKLFELLQGLKII